MLKAVVNNQTFERKYWLTFTSEIIKTTANKLLYSTCQFNCMFGDSTESLFMFEGSKWKLDNTGTI